MFIQKKINTCLWSKKKVIVMDINKTINLIKKTAKLEVIGIK